MKKHIKFVALMMSLLLAVSIAACGQTGNNSSSQSSQSSGSGENSSDQSSEENTSSEVTASESPEIELWVGYVRDFSEVTKVQDQWRERLGFNIRCKNVSDDVGTALNLAISSDGFKDFAVLPKNDVYNNTIVRSGKVMEVTDILADSKYPNISSVPEEYLSVSADKDGKYWYLPTYWDVSPDDPWPGWTWDAFLVREDLLAELKMEKSDIKTLDDFEQYLYAVSKLKAPDGEPIIPVTYINGGDPASVNSVLTAFGVKTGRASGAVASVDKVDGEFKFMYDDPNYKRCFQWLNHLLREGLMDEESLIQDGDICKQKIYNGKYGATMGRQGYEGTKPGDVAREYEIIPFPLADGVTKPGQRYVTNPYPKASVYISKTTENLDAILEFMDWAMDKDPIRNFELNEGVEGIFWHWVDEPYGIWDFEPDYLEERNNPATHSNLQPELYMLGTFSKEWYRPLQKSDKRGLLPGHVHKD